MRDLDGIIGLGCKGATPLDMNVVLNLMVFLVRPAD